MPVTPSKGPRPNLGEHAASASKLSGRKTTADPRRIRSAKASRISEFPLDPENPAVSEKPVYKARELLKRKNAPTTTRPVEATAKLANNPSESSIEPADDEEKPDTEFDSEEAVNRDLTLLVKNFIQDTALGERHTYIYETIVEKGDHAIFKIGLSINPNRRRSQIAGQCKFTRMREVPAAIEDRPSKAALMAEKIIQLELRRFKCTGTCACGSKHREYFAVSKAVALKARKRWVDFCNQKPWGPDGKLLSFWEDRLKERRPLAEGCGYDGLAASWEQFTKPSKIDRETWNWKIRFGFLESQRIYAVALIEAYVIAFFLPSGYSVVLCIVMSYCVGGSSSRAWATHEALFIEVPEEKQEVLVNRVDGKNVVDALGEKPKTDPPVEVIDLTVDGEEERGSVPVVKSSSQVKVAELSREEIRGGPSSPWDVESEDDEGAGDLGKARDNDSEEDEEKDEGGKNEDAEMEDRDDGDEMDCDEMDYITDDGILAHGMGAVSLTGSSNLKAVMPTLLGDDSGARLSSRPVLVQA
ncbi:hypothetical protein F5X68DRAFT_203863 [Plectosphaerella plurivora]|uniref:Bacteriophage T5 Orf172 DNA-binding domain-containing protein n=1 Tax=Plectosphaerella plurivora TaxID=936078 RepID=A0A9P9ABU1_9PEZI|nr:hypothetical protein F5X68DRAFT_203863 [Plectosphaerella plurivora]